MKLVSSTSLSIALIAAATTGGSIFGVAEASSGLERRIVGGSAVGSSSAAEYSFVANILATTDGKSAYACTGALIAPNVVLVAASCVANSLGSKALETSQVVVGQGSSNPAAGLALVAKGGKSVDMTKALSSGYVAPQSVTLHPGYNSIAFTDNIAVLVLAQPLTTQTNAGAKLIVKPSATTGATYAAVGWGVTSATNATAYAQTLRQLPLTVADKGACTEIWAPYDNLTNSLCLQPTDSAKANVCTGDGLLVKTSSTGGSVAVAGLLNIVADEGEVPAYQCAGSSGKVDFFTTFANYVSWLTEVTPLDKAAFVSTDSFDYHNVEAGGQAGSGNDGSASESGESSLGDDESSSSSSSGGDLDDEDLTSVESSTDSGAAGLFASALTASVSAVVLAASSLLF
ncbi:hypothetical protein H4S06_000200 [Coemansia sp. BCRC 34490]|nr:hypothetical protein H4S06_000200 [Coemansia sp. BCRC 34490]